MSYLSHFRRPESFRNNLSNQFQTVFDQLFQDWGTNWDKTQWKLDQFNPSAEITETNEAYQFKFDLPGLTKDQIKIDLKGDTLIVSGERKEEKNENTQHHHISEISYGSFTRSFTLPTQVDPERVDAKYENGILSLQLYKSEKSKSRQITIK